MLLVSERIDGVVHANLVDVGISNFNILKTKRVLEVARIRPAVNQVELHP